MKVEVEKRVVRMVRVTHKVGRRNRGPIKDRNIETCTSREMYLTWSWEWLRRRTGEKSRKRDHHFNLRSVKI